jgi:anthranilate/para-aminobenzoate synthase component I
LESAKDRAELLMITDLERNDLGRVCQAGTVKTKSLVNVQELAQVHHLYSVIEGQLRGDVKTTDVLAACFPGGSITGAPKIRAMQIIRELEPHSREVYTGAIGYMGVDGQSHFNIPIRTMIYQGGRIKIYAGGGIVADSDSDSEYEECWVKAKGMRETLEMS